MRGRLTGAALVAVPAVAAVAATVALIGMGCAGGGASAGSDATGGGGAAMTAAGSGGGPSGGAGGAAATDGGGDVGADHRIAPGGYYTDGNKIYDAHGLPHLFHGVDRPSLEWNAAGEQLSAQDFQLMASWKANVVRIALNQDFWLQNTGSYPTTIDNVIGWAEAAGMDVILDLHWSDKGQLGVSPAQQVMADMNSVTFWQQVAARYKGDGRVLFELYNEPHDVSWEIWQNGGSAGGFQVAGMQQLYDAVRGAGADNLVIVGGLVFAFDLSGVPTHRIAGYNIAYASHPYLVTGRERDKWDASFGFLAATDPIIITEFGTFDCSTEYYAQVLSYADGLGMSWTAWAWYVNGCAFPSLVSDWNGTPNAPGALIKASLLAY
jgi:endoglucanase